MLIGFSGRLGEVLSGVPRDVLCGSEVVMVRMAPLLNTVERYKEALLFCRLM